VGFIELGLFFWLFQCVYGNNFRKLRNLAFYKYFRIQARKVQKKEIKTKPETRRTKHGTVRKKKKKKERKPYTMRTDKKKDRKTKKPVKEKTA